MSEVREQTSAFFDLYRANSVPEAAINDFIEDWHRSGEEESRELWQFLGMTKDEDAVWIMDARALPLLRMARETHESLVTAVGRYLDGLRASNALDDRAAIHSLAHWVVRRTTGCAG